MDTIARLRTAFVPSEAVLVRSFNTACHILVNCLTFPEF